MTPVEILGAGVALVVAVGAGTIAHELSHALTLRAFDVPYELQWLPDSEQTGPLATSIAGGLATVRPHSVPTDLSPWKLRIAALMPLVLAAPLALVVLGLVPDPFQTGNVYLSGAAVGWLACALPSPRDFSLVWYAQRALSSPTREREKVEWRDTRH